MGKNLLLLVLAITIVGGAYLYSNQHKKTGDDIIEVRESKYNNIYVYKRGRIKLLSFGYKDRKYTESAHDPSDKSSLPAIYTRYMTVSALYPQSLNDMLVIGLGAGKTSKYMHDTYPRLKIDAVELDGEVLELAEKYFDFQETDRLRVHIEDGRKHLMKSDKKYDIVMLDAFRGPFVPFHLLTKEFFEIIGSKLTETGVVAQNIETTTMLFDSTVATFKAAFKNVEFFDTGANVILIAYNGEKRNIEELKNKARTLETHHNPRYKFSPILEKRKFYKEDKTSKVLTDDFAPVNSLKAIEKHNLKWEE